MINEAPEFPAFTDWIIRNRHLHEPMRIVDVGVQGGLHPRWKWLGELLEVWAFDPLPEVIKQLSANNPAPDRVRYYRMGLGNEDGARLFSRNPNAYTSAFLPAVMTDDQIGRDAAGKLPDYWSRPTIRKMDSLMAEGLLGPIDHLKMDCEGFEVEVLKGAGQFLKSSGVFAIESESHLKLHPWHTPCHFSEVYAELAPHGFDVYDAYFYRSTRPALPSERSDRGRPDTWDFLFLRGFGADDPLEGLATDRLIKMMIVAELYALHDVAADILSRAHAVLTQRFPTMQAMELLQQSSAR